MDKSHFWFLDVVVKLPCAVAVLGSRNVEMALNRKGHGLGHQQLTVALLTLHTAGLIDFTWAGDPRSPSRSIIEAELRSNAKPRERLFAYGLTAKGGAAWEAVTQPDWSRFLDVPWLSAEGILEAAGMDRARLEQELVPYMNPLGTEETRVFDAQWDVLAPWQATYWKTLPSGHRVRAKYQTHRMADARRCADFPGLLDAWRQHGEDRAGFLKWYQSQFEG